MNAEPPAEPRAVAAAPLAVEVLRRQVDALDAGMRRLLAARRGLVRAIGAVKRRHGLPPRDPARERTMAERAARDAERLGLPAASAAALLAVALDDARQASSGSPGRDGAGRALLETAVRRGLEAALSHALRGPLAAGAFDACDGRALGIEVADLGWRWVVVVRGRRIEVRDGAAAAEATVRAAAPDLVLLAARRADPDALFFARRLELGGDTELGLIVRNVLDQLALDELPLGLRVALEGGARLAQFFGPPRG